jgi:hypothetical protein
VLQLEAAIEHAIDHLATHDDTDIFPSPLDGIALFRDRDASIAAVIAHHQQFDERANLEPPTVIRSLVPAGYHGLRLGSQIPPIWNAYYLSLVIACAPAIERFRVSPQSVFSYRFELSAASPRLFDPSKGWNGYIDATRVNCARHSHVLVTDISDFYHRVRIEPLGLALLGAGVANALVERVTKLLRLLEVDRFGLPIGGPASRLLAELALARFDDSVRKAGISCVRYVDDLRVFSDDEGQAQKHLLTLSALAWEDGFTLQRGKTRIMRSRDLLEELSLAHSLAMLAGGDSTEQTALTLQRTHDPYAELRAQVDLGLAQFASEPNAAAGMLREFAKVRLNLSLVRNLLAALRFIDAEDLGSLLLQLLDDCERPAMMPVFGRLIEAIDANLDRLPHAAVLNLRDRLIAFIEGDGALAGVDLHCALSLRLLCRLPYGEEQCLPQSLLVRCRGKASALVKREAIALCAAWKDRRAHQELTSEAPFGPWERAVAAMSEGQVRSLTRALGVQFKSTDTAR